MSVYVDPMMACVPNGRWRWNRSCHMFADTLEELHAFALRIGLKREWFQPAKDRHIPHYDLHESRRAAAVKLGAIEVDRRRAVEIWDRIHPARARKGAA